MIYGYARVSTRGQADGNSLEAQEEALRGVGAEVVYKEAFTGTQTDRPELTKLIEKLQSGDRLIVTKLDRIARSVSKGIDLIDELLNKGVTVHILNMGVLDDTAAGRLIRNVFLAFAEFEQDMIVERTQEGKAIAKQQPGYREGRPRKFGKDQIQHAMDLLKDHSYSQVEKMTGISKSTLIRARKNK